MCEMRHRRAEVAKTTGARDAKTSRLPEEWGKLVGTKPGEPQMKQKAELDPACAARVKSVTDTRMQLIVQRSAACKHSAIIRRLPPHGPVQLSIAQVTMHTGTNCGTAQNVWRV